MSELKAQEKVLSARLEAVMNMVADLQHINQKDGREVDEIRAFVSDMLRVFSHEHDTAKHYATGFSGDFKKGTMTAYDSLNPKPWKPSK